MYRSLSLLALLLGVGACAPQGTGQIDDLRAELKEVRTELREVRTELRALRGLPPEDPESPSGEEGEESSDSEARAPGADAGADGGAPVARANDSGAEAGDENAPGPGGNADDKAVAGRTVKLSIQSNPSGAALYIDGKRKGNTPVLIDLPASKNELEIRLDKPGYLPRIQTVRPEEDTKLSLQLSKR